MGIIKIILFALVGIGFLSCDEETSNAGIAPQKLNQAEGLTIASRFQPPKDYQRFTIPENSFAHFLRELPLYPASRKVKLYNGELKSNQRAQAAVINMDVGSRDLQQCADAVMRLRAEYLWQQKTYDKIQFNFTNGFPANYQKWRDGYRLQVNGNNVVWTDGQVRDTSYASFRKYLIQVFNYAGTHSLSKELHKVNINELRIGDVFIQGGFPGHAIIVVDKAENPQTNDFAFLLAQSYMPAQDIHVLVNPNENGAWYFSKDLENELRTPEWTFELTDLKRF